MTPVDYSSMPGQTGEKECVPSFPSHSRHLLWACYVAGAGHGLVEWHQTWSWSTQGSWVLLCGLSFPHRVSPDSGPLSFQQPRWSLAFSLRCPGFLLLWIISDIHQGRNGCILLCSWHHGTSRASALPIESLPIVQNRHKWHLLHAAFPHCPSLEWFVLPLWSNSPLLVDHLSTDHTPAFSYSCWGGWSVETFPGRLGWEDRGYHSLSPGPMSNSSLPL